MVNTRQANDTTPVAPVVKRKRRASCLGEQERRERKRAIDREAQRSLREKTKTHIAELERTIQILRDQDRNEATSSLLSEIDTLRTENERLRDVIESVKSVIGGDVFSSRAGPSTTANANDRGHEHSPAASSVGRHTPKPRTASFTDGFRPAHPTPNDASHSFEFEQHAPNNSHLVDLDGMKFMSDVEPDISTAPSANNDFEMHVEVTVKSPEEVEEEMPWGDDPATATWGPLMAEFFGPNWRSPSPIILHIGNPDPPASAEPTALCPVWKKSNELFNKVFSYRPSTGLTDSRSADSEAGLLYMGIKKGWDMTSKDWTGSPVLQILKQVDDLLFCHLPNMERLAVAYKSFKLLKYYLNATKEELAKVPAWLQPSPSQSSTSHPIAVDFFAWPTLRDRLVQNHASIFQSGDLSKCYSEYLRFDWPFAFEDAFFLDEGLGEWRPSPMFERHHGDLKYWTVDRRFYGRFPEMERDIEGDRERFCEVGG